MKKIGIVSCNKWKNKIIEDCSIQKQFVINGFDCDIISWEDKEIDYNEYECLLLRSVWGYQNNYEAFISWLSFIKENNIKLYNSVETIKNNIRKDIQFHILDENGIPHIPTKFYVDIDGLNNLSYNSVIKPIISGSGNNTFIVTPDNIQSVKKIFNNILLCRNNGFMVQPYIKDIEHGEYSIVFIGNTNTHNMIRTPGIFTEKIKPYEIKSIPQNVIDLANKVKSISDLKDSLYMRIDIVGDEKPLIMEVELAEPDLLTRYISSQKPVEILCKELIKRL